MMNMFKVIIYAMIIIMLVVFLFSVSKSLGVFLVIIGLFISAIGRELNEKYNHD